MTEPFGKFYAKAFTGSMMGAGPTVFSVMAYAVANAKPPDGLVELNPALLAVLIGTSKEAIEDAISYLQSPDPGSRSPAENGKRLVQESKFLYRLVNWLNYRGQVDDEARKQYFRAKMAERRRKDRLLNGMSCTVLNCTGTVTQAEAEAEACTYIGKSDKSSSTSDEEWLEHLKKNPAYASLDVGMEYGRMAAWCEANHKQPTRRRFINWLNRADRPMAGPQLKNNGSQPRETSQSPSSLAYALGKQKESLEKQVQAARNKGYEDAMGLHFPSEPDRVAYLDLKRRMRELEIKLSNLT